MNYRFGGKVLLIAMFCLLGTLSFGQIMNIEKFRLDSLSRKDPFRLKLEMNFDFYNRSATEDEQARFYSIGSEISAVMAPGRHFYMLLGNIRYVENNAQKILNNGHLHLRTTLNYSKTFSPEFFSQVQYDNFRGLNNRFLIGAAGRWNTVNSERLMLALGTGPMYEIETWTSPINEEEVDIQLLKWSTNVIIRWTVNNNIDCNAIFYYQVGYDESINEARHRYTNTTNLNFQINDRLSFKFGARFAYEDRPVVPITKFIYTIENGINFNF